MAIPLFDVRKGYESPQLPGMSQAAGGGQGLDPTLLRLLAARRQKQGMVQPTTQPGLSAPPQAAGFRVQAAPIDPRLRAAMMLKRKLQEQQRQSQAPQYGRESLRV